MTGNQTQMKTMTAVIFDDDPVIRSLLTGVLSSVGYKVTSYSNPVKCPLYSDPCCPCSLDGACPDLIISDYDMPGVNGLEFIENIRNKNCRCMNIAVMSGSWVEDDLRQILPTGVSVLSKPFTLNRFGSWLNEVRAKSGGMPGAANRRTSTRYPCDFPVELYFNSPGLLELVSAVARNISTGGMLIESSKILEPMMSFQVAFTLQDWMSAKGVSDHMTMGNPHHIMVAAQSRHGIRTSGTYGLQFLESFT